MGFKIISNRDKDGNFIASADHWDDAKIDVLLKKNTTPMGSSVCLPL